MERTTERNINLSFMTKFVKKNNKKTQTHNKSSLGTFKNDYYYALSLTNFRPWRPTYMEDNLCQMQWCSKSVGSPFLLFFNLPQLIIYILVKSGPFYTR
jgi:hypothetical protein